MTAVEIWRTSSQLSPSVKKFDSFFPVIGWTPFPKNLYSLTTFPTPIFYHIKMYPLLKLNTINYFGDYKFMAYIIDTFNKYNKWDREHAQYTFSINECPYAIMEVPISNELP